MKNYKFCFSSNVEDEVCPADYIQDMGAPMSP
jgi:hypothetical protein